MKNQQFPEYEWEQRSPSHHWTAERLLEFELHAEIALELSVRVAVVEALGWARAVTLCRKLSRTVVRECGEPSEALANIDPAHLRMRCADPIWELRCHGRP
jgi:hypothetical protein